MNGSYFNYIYDYQLSNRLDKNNIFGYYRGGDTYLKFNKSNNNTYIALYDIPIKSNNLTFKIFKSYCLIKSGNTTEKINDIKFCKESKLINSSNIEIINDKNSAITFKLKYWKNKELQIKETRYYFYQGINSKGKCDKKLGFKSCGYLTNLHCEFCVKKDILCPLLYNNTDINNLTFNSFVTNIDFFFHNNSFNDNLYRNEKNIKHDFDKIEFIEKDNVYNFFKDNKILKTLLFFMMIMI